MAVLLNTQRRWGDGHPSPVVFCRINTEGNHFRSVEANIEGEHAASKFIGNVTAGTVIIGANFFHTYPVRGALPFAFGRFLLSVFGVLDNEFVWLGEERGGSLAGPERGPSDEAGRRFSGTS